jgi:16S rRNA (cytidine1402-2'-O)-methyltransferase
MSGKLYICATPIGNLGDVSQRLLDTLAKVSVIAAEDTRVTQRLLDRFNIRKKMVSLQKFNENARIDHISNYLKNGEDVALVSDAGTPNIADPGAYTVACIRELGFEVVAVPGPSSVTAFLSIAGVLANQFYFGGFFPKKDSEALAFIQKIAVLESPWLFFESGLRVEKTLQFLSKHVDIEKIVLGKELTKQFETVYSGSYEAVYEQFKEGSPKGEWVVLVVSRPPQKPPLDDLIASLKQQKMSPSQMRFVAHSLLHYPKNEVYDKSHD